MPRRPAAIGLRCHCVGAWTLCLFAQLWLATLPGPASAQQRFTPLVRAIERAKPAVVNVFGEKQYHDAGRSEADDDDRRVNGMGTGVLLDPRGYILTNHHVVDGVKQIQVTLANGETFTAELISYDISTDLAVIKIDAKRTLPVIPIGRSDDLMPGENVAAVGNAFGYGHTVTSGIISALHRTVQVSDAQQYDDLIQTDASINPGNSGGPLLNINGELIGINVAVRAGAQGIGFAIPSDRALQIAARLLNVERLHDLWHGVTVDEQIVHSKRVVVVREVDEDSPAAKSGIQPGDRIDHVGELDVVRHFDLERALIDHLEGDQVTVTVIRDGQSLELQMQLARSTGDKDPVSRRTWDTLGLRLVPIPEGKLAASGGRYRGGLRVMDVRNDGPAQERGIVVGDVLVGMHVWETVSLENVSYVLDRLDEEDLQPLKFYILRREETLYGFMPLKDTRLR